jgi:hypothetical protein
MLENGVDQLSNVSTDLNVREVVIVSGLKLQIVSLDHLMEVGTSKLTFGEFFAAASTSFKSSCLSEQPGLQG